MTKPRYKIGETVFITKTKERAQVKELIIAPEKNFWGAELTVFRNKEYVDVTLKLNEIEKLKSNVLRAAQGLTTLKPLNIKVKVKKLSSTATLPTQGTIGSAGYDLRVDIPEGIKLVVGERKLIGTGLSFEIPKGYVMFIYPRSGLALKYGLTLTNCVPVIDSDYRGEVGLIVQNNGEKDVVIDVGDRLAQAIIMPFPTIKYIEVNELDSTDRGNGGFGSTGVQ